LARLTSLIRLSLDRGAALLLLLSLLFGLAACSGTSQPFGKSSGTAGATGKTPPPITLVQLNGLPAEKRQPFTELLVEAAAGYDIAIVQGAFGDGLRLDGAFTVDATAAGTAVGFDWKLADPTGKLLQSFSGAEVEGGSGGKGWAGVSEKLLQQVAQSTAQTLSAKLASMGYATRSASIAPPSGWVTAGADAAAEIDYETFYGPGTAPSASAATTTASLSTPEPQATATRGDAAATPSPASAAPGAIKAIAILPVTGSKSKGNEELRAALAGVLSVAGWPVVRGAQKGALSIKGEVTIEPPKGKTQAVAIAWAVSTPEGRVLGTVRQANEVAAGSLDNGWGDLAKPVAQSAADGLFDLVDDLRR
jgi:hypothetical protein